MGAIDVKHLYKIFGGHQKQARTLAQKGTSREEILKATGATVAVNDVSFTIEKRETFVVMGLSGSGKSTLIRCLNRLIEPSFGEVHVQGKNIMQLELPQLRKMRRYAMSMVFQHFGLLPHRNVINNVEYGLEIGGMAKEERNSKAMDALKLVGLQGYEKNMPSELSGGMQQRVGLARALANNPEILLMDEAFSALDPLIRTQMQDELLELQAKMHKTIVFITHDLDEALKLGDRILILGPDGTVRQIGTAEEILANPADDYVDRFVEKVDRTKVITAASIMRRTPTVTIPKNGPHFAVRLMEEKGTSALYVIDDQRRVQGIVTIDDTVELLKKEEKSLESIIIKDIYTTYQDTTVADLITTAVTAKYPIAVIDQDNVFHGIVDRAAVLGEVGEEADDSKKPRSLSEVSDE
jgi:glycine betaine/proline transport system ATP-binding protein